MQTFATPAPIIAILGIPAGRIQFIAADRDSTTVEIRPANPSKGRDVKLAGQTTAAYGDGILQITSTAGNRGLGSSGAVEVIVQLPTGSRVAAKAASAQFTAAGQLGVTTVLVTHEMHVVGGAALAGTTLTIDAGAFALIDGEDDEIVVVCVRVERGHLRARRARRP